ncbi:MAG: potassium efflux system protein, partial [Sulfitobacter sp.]
MNEILTQALGYADPAIDLARDWLTSPAAWSQFGLLIVAYLAAKLAAKRATPLLTRLLTPADDAASIFATSRRFVLIFLPLLLPLLAYGFTAIGEQITRAIFDSGAVIAFGKRV